MKSFSTLLIFFTLFFTLCLWSCKKDEPTPQPQPDPEPTIEAGTISGIVRYAGVLGESGLPIYPLDSAKIELLSNESLAIISSTSTNREGYFMFTNLPAGNYNIKISSKFSSDILSLNASLEEGKGAYITNDGFECINYRVKPKVKKKWTFIHLANGASQELVTPNMKEIYVYERNGGSNENLNNIAFLDVGHGDAQLIYLEESKIIPNPDPLDVFDLRPVFTSPTYIYSKDSDNYTQLGDIGDYKSVIKKIEEIINLYPADSIALFMYGHGTGIELIFDQTKTNSKALTPNHITHKAINVTDLGNMFKELKSKGIRIDALIPSACYMGMYEVAYELKDCGLKYICASELTSSGVANASQNIKYNFINEMRSGTATLNSVLNELVEKSPSITTCVYDMEKITDLSTKFNEFSKQLNLYKDALILQNLFEKSLYLHIFNKDDLPSYEHNYIDLASFALLVSNMDDPSADELKKSAKVLYDYITMVGTGNFISMYNLKQGYDSFSGLSSMGLCRNAKSWDEVKKDYQVLNCYKDNKEWSNFLDKFKWIDNNQVWDGSVSEPKLSDMGDYLISKPSELAWIAKQTNEGAKDFKGYGVKLTSNLNMGGERNQKWVPIGTLNNPFKGDFDGAGFIIDSLAIEATNIPSVGLFGYAVDCSFKNVFLRSGEIKVIQNKDFDELFMSIGGICGNLIGITYPASVNNVWSHLNIKVEAESKHINIGGIIGLAENAVTISNATCSSTITSNAKNNRTTSTGAVLGEARERSGMSQIIIDNAYINNAIMNLSGTGPINAGGVLGLVNTQKMVIRNCKIAIAVDASAKGDINVGGVVGIAENGKPYIYNCNVLNNNGRGGLRGDIITPSTSDIFMGGVMGDGEADIYACDVSIEIKTAGNCAGIIGRHNGGTIAACSNYSLTDKAGIAVVTSDASFVDNCYFISKKGAVDVPAKAKITNCHQYSQDNWPKANMLGWGETAPLNWDSSYTWAKYWTSLGSWKDIISIYPSVKGNSKI